MNYYYRMLLYMIDTYCCYFTKTRGILNSNSFLTLLEQRNLDNVKIFSHAQDINVLMA